MSPQITIVPAWALDNNLLTLPHTDNPFRKTHGLQNNFVVMYAGNHSVCHPLDTLLEAAYLLREKTEIKFVFVGNGDRVNDVKQYKETHHLTNILQIEHHNREELKYCLSAADLHVAVMGNGYVGIVHPCKIYGILAIGRPFVYIGPEESHITQIMRENGIGYKIQHDQPRELAEVVKKAMQLSQAEIEAIMQLEKAVVKKFSQQALCSQLADIITNE